jgi:hypothetical protein
MDIQKDQLFETTLSRLFSRTRIKRMMLCAVIAMLLNLTSWMFPFNPFTWFAGVQGIIFNVGLIGLYIIPYGIIGSIVDYFLRKKRRLLRTVSIWLSVNVVIIAIILYFMEFSFLRTAPSEARCISPLGFIIPILSVIGSLLSIIPIGYVCKHSTVEN